MRKGLIVEREGVRKSRELLEEGVSAEVEGIVRRGSEYGRDG